MTDDKPKCEEIASVPSTKVGRKKKLTNELGYKPRVGWAKKFKKMNESGDDTLIWDDLLDINLIPEFRRYPLKESKVDDLFGMLKPASPIPVKNIDELRDEIEKQRLAELGYKVENGEEEK